MSAILGIDAAWTAGRPSGVALLQQRGERWRCVALAPSYAQFEGLAAGCAVHSPSAERPGALADRLRAEAARLGYPLATAANPAGRTPALLEVYPHPALLRLLGARYRLPYKVANRRKYWPDATPAERLARVLQRLDEILAALRRAVDGVPLDVHSLAEIASAASLKAIEDALDALICGWVGTRYLAGRCRAYGDDTAAIWIPTEEP